MAFMGATYLGTQMVIVFKARAAHGHCLRARTRTSLILHTNATGDRCSADEVESILGLHDWESSFVNGS